MTEKGQKNKSQLSVVDLAGKVNCSVLEQKLGTSLGPLLEAFSLGLNDRDAAELAEVSEEDVRQLRAILGQAGSSLGLNFKKPICQQKKDQPG
ncbi:MAG: hypothetical protein GX952_03185 [Firmicutes bacterium]|nr:hypothetical protein [Bacillota bacterium]